MRGKQVEEHFYPALPLIGQGALSSRGNSICGRRSPDEESKKKGGVAPAVLG